MSEQLNWQRSLRSSSPQKHIPGKEDRAWRNSLRSHPLSNKGRSRTVPPKTRLMPEERDIIDRLEDFSERGIIDKGDFKNLRRVAARAKTQFDRDRNVEKYEDAIKDLYKREYEARQQEIESKSVGTQHPIKEDRYTQTNEDFPLERHPLQYMVDYPEEKEQIPFKNSFDEFKELSATKSLRNSVSSTTADLKPQFREVDKELIAQIQRENKSNENSLPPQFRLFDRESINQIPRNREEPKTPTTSSMMSDPGTRESDKSYYGDVSWSPVNTDKLNQRAFSNWIHSAVENPQKPENMNCYEGVCYDLISREKLSKDDVRKRLTGNFPGNIQAPVTGKNYSETLLNILNPEKTRRTVSYDDVLENKHTIPVGSVVFANSEEPGEHAFITRGGSDYEHPVRSLWSEERGTGNFSRDQLSNVLGSFITGKKRMDAAVPKNLSYNTAFVR